MMQKITIGTIAMLCLVLAIFGFTNKHDFSYLNTATIKSTNFISSNSSDNITMVFPNPESCILNLNCSSKLKSPITVLALNTKGDIVKTINSLIAEGNSKFKYIQMSISGLEKGKYTFIITDFTGKTSTRKIYIN